MRHFLSNIVTVLSLTVLGFGCQNSEYSSEESYLPEIEVNGPIDGLIEIKEWFAVGPFDFNPQKQLPEETFFNKELRRYGIGEKKLDISVASRLVRKKMGFNILGQSSRVSLMQYTGGDVSEKSNFYLFVSIISTSEQAVSLVFDGSNSYNVWLNGEKLLEVRGKYNVNKVGDRFVNVELNEGENLLAVKINRGLNVKSWDLFCAVANAKTAEDIYRANYGSDFILNPIANDSLGFYLGPYTKASVSISNASRKLLFSSNVDADVLSKTAIELPNEYVEGFYNCALTLPDNNVIEEFFYKGSFMDFVDKTSELIRERGYKWPSGLKMDIDVGYKRLIYLVDKPDDPVSPSQQRLIDRNRVLWGYSLQVTLSMAKNESTEMHTGTFLRSFTDEYKSLGDGFISFIPKSFVAEEKIALVVVVPYALDGESIISDWYTDNLDQIMADNHMADEYGFAMAWMYSGGKNYSLSVAVEEANAVVERMRELLCGKLGPIYIVGDCEGARRALLIAETEPEMFNGIALTSPIVSSFANEQSPLNAIGNLRNIPVIAKHGVNDITSPVENSRRLVDAANNASVDITYLETEDGHLTFSKNYRRYAFEFFEKINEKAD